MRRRVDVLVDDTKKSAYNFAFSGPLKLTDIDAKVEEKRKQRERLQDEKIGQGCECTPLRAGIVGFFCLLLAVGVILGVYFATRPTMDMSSSNATSIASATTASSTTTASTATEAPVLITTGAPAIEISFVCNHVLTGADAGFCLGVFSYNNPTGESITVPIGANNYMTPGPLAPSHPTNFVAGLRYGAVTSRWHCNVATSLSWIVRSGDGVSVATTSAAHHECPPLPL